MATKALTRWLAGVIAVIITIQLAKLLNLQMAWKPAWHVVLFIPVLTAANATLGTILKLFSAPISCITLGLFGFVINALVFLIAGKLTGADMGFLAALFGSVVMTLVAAPLNKILTPKGDK